MAPRRLGRFSAGRLFLPCDLLSCAVTRERVAGPNPELASEDTSRRIVSMEEDCSVSFGSVSPRSCHRIFGFNTARFFFLPVLRPFHTVEIFMAYSLCWATGLFSGSSIGRQRSCPAGDGAYERSGYRNDRAETGVRGVSRATGIGARSECHSSMWSGLSQTAWQWERRQKLSMRRVLGLP